VRKKAEALSTAGRHLRHALRFSQAFLHVQPVNYRQKSEVINMNGQIKTNEGQNNETSQPAADINNAQKGDYTKYFYRNIDRLWEAVQQLQEENSRLKTAIYKAHLVIPEV